MGQAGIAAQDNGEFAAIQRDITPASSRSGERSRARICVPSDAQLPTMPLRSKTNPLMKTFPGSSLRLILWLAACALFGLRTQAITFTTDTTIGAFDTNYDGADIIVTNCTVTVDGLHSFAILQVRNGGALTHTQVPDGSLQFSNSITGEAHVLISTNGFTLNQTKVIATSIVVRDVTGTITYANGVDYEVGSGTLHTAILRTPGSSIPDGSTILVDYSALFTIPTGINLIIGGDMVIEPGGSINANARGYGAGFGPGTGNLEGHSPSGSGAGHGGYGGLGTSNTIGGGIYGSILLPTDKGSSGSAGTGGVGGIGGGAIKLVVGGALQINGGIAADGANANNSRAGGGSGGSVWLSAQTFSGTGSISVDGGAGEPIHGGGGGGGRIAVYFATNLFSGSIATRGGAGFVTGGAGTLYRRNTNQPTGLVLVDNGGRAGTNTVLSASDRFDLTVRGQAVVSAGASGVLTVGNLLIASNGFVAGFLGSAPVVLRLTATNNATIEAGGGILADGGGDKFGNSGTGAGSSTNAGDVIGNVGSGGGHGGYGGSGGVGPGGGATHGNLSAPLDFGARGGGAGSQKPGSAGGGAIRLTVNGALRVDGRISANGLSSEVPNNGGGSGGSVWITAGTLSGSGLISANGGAGNGLGGGGGGGRIALSADFSGAGTAYGGGGASRGGAGTIFMNKMAATGQLFQSITVDNGGHWGTNTTLGSFSTLTADLTVAGGALLVWPSTSAFTMRNLLITSNAVLIATNSQSITLTVMSNATIQAGGWIKGDGEGLFAAQQGNGSANFSPTYGTTGGGGGHGGNGSPSLGGAAGGVSFDSAILPESHGGSGAQVVTSGPPQGGAGGAAIRLDVTGTLLLDGKLSVDGHDGYSLHSGGGAGGSIRVTAGRFIGSGLISANGGRGNGVGGSGGGGRIAVTYGTNLFSGAITAYGGRGVTWGGAGTIYSARITGQSLSGAQLIVDNGGPLGAASLLPTIGAVDLILRDGAQATAPFYGFSPPLRNVFIGSNAWLLISNSSSTIIISNVTVFPGGGISADGKGFGAGTGPGAGRTVSGPSGISGSGAGHGGAGGNSSGGATGGGTYDSVTGPIQTGSGGGAGSGTSSNAFGGQGGGVVRLTVSGSLQLDGRIGADGMPGVGLNSGGGSGGSIWLTVGTLAGSGRISANGGAGNGLGGGGGGGGRIAISYATNTFSGLVSAFGGRGFVYGGAGTIYYQPTKQNIAQLLVDNGGPKGAGSDYSRATPYPASAFDLAIQGGAMVVLAPVPIRNLLIASNSWLVVSNTVTAEISGDFMIEAGGGINADGVGSGGGQGAGVGGTLASALYGTTGGGGGHGGFGGASSAGAAGGNAYDSITTPVLFGGDGGGNLGGASVFLGGAGGRAFRLNATRGTLRLDGKISADGHSGNQHGGGGSGGSVWLNVGTLSGAGIISATGGAGSGVGGGGGGGRISLSFTSNSFTGAITAHGGLGTSGTGGAGTIYTRAGNQSIGQVLVDNGGLFGTNTPIANIGIFDLAVTGGATAFPSSSFLILSNLFVNRDGLVTSGPGQTNLELAVLNHVAVGAGSAIAVAGLGFGQGSGLGAGQSAGGFGGGGGYGGAGGASVAAPGGPSHGSATQPVAPGSGGGFGSGPLYGGSQGGGAIRLNVGGTLTVDGWLCANGIPGFQDGSGGGSGGSLWVNARTVRGNGFITADGGEGELFGGGGGGGGRVAVYYLTNPGHTNNFTGDMTAYAGEGFYWGEDGSVFYSSGVGALQAVSHTPGGVVSNAVSSVDLVFNTALNPFSASSADVAFTTPNGPLAAGFLTISRLSPSSLRITFPEQTAVGNYTFTIGPQIDDLYGRSMAQSYTGAFTISLPTIQGTITDTNGLPVSGVLIQHSGALSSATSDANGNYALGFVPGRSFTVTPRFGQFMFAPGNRSYTTTTATIPDQNYVMVATIGPSLSGELQGMNLITRWHGLPGVTYQLYYSTNLVDWLPHGALFTGSNALVQIPLPLDDAPKKFFRVQASN